LVRDVNEAARDVARALAKTQAFAQSRRSRKKVEMLFAHLKRRSVLLCRTTQLSAVLGYGPPVELEG
jgi:hypothetical protein